MSLLSVVINSKSGLTIDIVGSKEVTVKARLAYTYP